MKTRPVELSSRIGRIFWYSGELYQRFTAALSANSRMTTRFGSGPPSISSVEPPGQETPAILLERGADRRPIGLEQASGRQACGCGAWRTAHSVSSSRS
jgi:hypothetical protein